MSRRADAPLQRLACIVREPYPTHRPDVEVLFAQELPPLGFSVLLVMQSAGQAPASALGWHRARVLVGATDGRGSFLHRVRKHVRGLVHEIRFLSGVSRRRFEILQVRDKVLIAAIAAVVARMRGLPFTFWMSFPIAQAQAMRGRDGTARYPLVSLVQGTVSEALLYKVVLPLSKHVFVQSEQMKRDVAARGVPEKKLTPVPMGISRKAVRSADAGARRAAEAAGARGTLLFGYLGTLNQVRRLDILIDVLGLVRRAGIDAKLLIVGDGDSPADRRRIEERTRQLALEEHVEITGFLPQQQAWDRMAQVDVGVSPFFPTPVLNSTSPTKLVEYFAMGLPVVANDHPEQKLVLSQSRGGICAPWGARHFARGLIWMARAGEERRRILGEKGREWVLQTRTYDTIAAKVAATYRQVLAEDA